MTDTELDDLEAKAKAATPGPWVLAKTRDDRQHSREWLADCFDHGALDCLHMVGVEKPGVPITEMIRATAITGNGPTSEANADFLEAANPSTVLALIAEVRSLRAQVENHMCECTMEHV